VKVAAALWRVLRGFGLVLAAIVIFVEEWGWRPLTAFAALLARWLHLQRPRGAHFREPAGRRPASLSRAGGAALPAQAAALWLIGQGETGLGVFIIVAAKVLGTAFVGRLFILVSPSS
jgi:hypothetical protein